MSASWESDTVPKEFLVSVELYVSSAAGASLLRKIPQSQRRKPDKRDSVKPSATIIDESKKVKEKSSWLSLAKSPSGTGHWRSATCKLSEEGERCLLNIYVDESILYQTLYIHLLNHTDIRQADTSLFFRKYCLGIYSVGGQRWSSNNTAEPVYLQFSSSDACNTWLALLRSYAIPEIYGRLFFPADGGSYRMWRQVELNVIQGRNLGNTKPFESAGGDIMDSTSEHDPVDLDVSCEIHLNDTLCGRTTVKKGIGSPDWHENFIFSDLPPFDNLEITVWREKKLFKPAVLGTVRIALTNFRRGESMDCWFPVVQPGPISSDLRVGELRLNIRVDEEIVLPYSSYVGLLKTFNSRNFLEWQTEFESKLKLKTIAPQLMSIAVANNKLIDNVMSIATREVEATPTSHSTLFRGNTVLTKVMELCMTWYGKAFLEASIGSVLRKLCAEKVAIEVDPVRSGKGARDVERNMEQLIFWCQEFWNQIYSVRMECPQEMRKLFERVRKLVEKRFQKAENPESRELPWQSVSAFCFLRFIVPAILHPHLFGLCPGLPPAPVQRSLTLIAKVIQNLANLNATVHKEEFMRGLKDFLQESRPAMIDYILVVSTPKPNGENYGSFSGSVSDRHDRLNVVNSLRERARTKPVLDREAIPILPHILDVPRHLAIITSAVIRNSRDYLSQPRPDDGSDQLLQEFCSRCFEVEEQALQRVSQLASKISSNHKRPAGGGSWSQSPRSPVSTRSPSSITSTVQGSPRKTKRPATAPSTSDTDRSHRRNLFDPAYSTSSRVFVRDDSSPIVPPSPDAKQGMRSKLLHLKSPSTDSIPSPGLPSAKPDKTVEQSPDDPIKRRKGLWRGIIWKR